MGQRSKLEAAAKRKVSPIPAIDLRHPAHSLVAVLFIRAVGNCLMHILLPSICENGCCSKARDWFTRIFTLRGLYHSIGCPTTYQTRHFFNKSKTNEDIAKKQTHYRHIPLYFSHNERTPVQISLKYLHLF